MTIEVRAVRAEEWRALRELRLQVHEDNARAEAAYRKLDFELTGATVEIAVGVEREMERRL